VDIDPGIQHIHTDGNTRHVVMGELIEQPALAVNARIVRHQHLRQLAMVLRIECVKYFLHSADMRHRGAKKDGFCPAARRWCL